MIFQMNKTKDLFEIFNIIKKNDKINSYGKIKRGDLSLFFLSLQIT